MHTIKYKRHPHAFMNCASAQRCKYDKKTHIEKGVQYIFDGEVADEVVEDAAERDTGARHGEVIRQATHRKEFAQGFDSALVQELATHTVSGMQHCGEKAFKEFTLEERDI